MFRFKLALSISTLFLLVFVSGACQVVMPDGTQIGAEQPVAVAISESQAACTLATLKGTYIFTARGVITDDDNKIVPYAEAGTWTVDGNGNAEGVVSITINGETIATKESFAATYDHISGCVFTAADGFGLEFDLYTTPSGKTVTYFSPGFSGTMFKQ